jgi:hypothetical protein
MSDRADQDLILMLARAFDRAWKRYYRPRRRTTIPKEIARPWLARRLVAMAKQGVKDEDALAAAGLLYLISITSEKPSWDELRIEGARATFITPWSIRLRVR